MVATPIPTAPLDLLCAQVDCEAFTLPTGSAVFTRGSAARAIYGVRRGIVELLGESGEKTCYRPGELFCFQDLVWHRGNHRIRFLWRFHKAHHADTTIDVGTALRFHPGELVLSSVAKALWVLAWGPTVVAWFLFEALVSFCAQFHHTNTDFPDGVERWLSWLVVTPRFHATHHAVDRRYGDANFSTILSLWDPLFGTRADAPAEERARWREEGIGLPEARESAFSLRAWFEEPFRRRNLDLPPGSGA